MIRRAFFVSLAGVVEDPIHKFAHVAAGILYRHFYPAIDKGAAYPHGALGVRAARDAQLFYKPVARISWIAHIA